jgi:hypothetical protein
MDGFSEHAACPTALALLPNRFPRSYKTSPAPSIVVPKSLARQAHDVSLVADVLEVVVSLDLNAHFHRG